MRKNLFVLVASFLLLKFAIAQNNDETNLKRFGFRAGANFSHMDFLKSVPPVNIGTNRAAGINIGFLMQVHLTRDLYFQPEYAYSQMGGKVKNADSSYKLNYFSLPVLLKYRVHNKIFLMAGPQFDLLIDAKKTVGGSTTKITHDTEERNLAGVAGVEFQLIPSFSICARYMTASTMWASSSARYTRV